MSTDRRAKDEKENDESASNTDGTGEVKLRRRSAKAAPFAVYAAKVSAKMSRGSSNEGNRGSALEGVIQKYAILSRPRTTLSHFKRSLLAALRPSLTKLRWIYGCKSLRGNVCVNSRGKWHTRHNPGTQERRRLRSWTLRTYLAG